MPRTRRFSHVDVFTREPLLGNGLAVVVDAEDLTDATMAAFARWTNQSETTFLLPPTDPGADYRVRIFTPGTELPFAGHPTLGSCAVWLDNGGVPATPGIVVQECGAGLVRIRRGSDQDGDRFAFAAPPLLRSGPADAAVRRVVAESLRLPEDALRAVQWVDNGPGWVAALLADADAVLAARPRFTELDLGLVGLHPPGSPQAIEVRGFFPKDGAFVEDPVTGSLNASVAQWLLGSGRLTAPYVAAQGTAIGRAGRIHVRQDDDGRIWVGGDTVTCVEGHLDL